MSEAMILWLGFVVIYCVTLISILNFIKHRKKINCIKEIMSKKEILSTEEKEALGKITKNI